MKYLFFGTPEFAAIILEKLIKASFIPQAVVCNPDKPVGRKKIITPPPVKKVIREKGLEESIKILQPEQLSSFLFPLSSLEPDLFIVAAYAKIIPQEILAIPRLGSIGVHPSLLPKYRGPTPIQTAILNGDEKTGVSLFLIDEKVDHGPILAKAEIQISQFETYKSLHDRLAELGADLLIKTLPKYINDEITPLPQDETQVTYTQKFKTEDAYIEPADLEKAQKEGGRVAIEIDRKIRAFNPEPGTWTRAYPNTKLYEITKTEKRVKLLETKIIDGKLKITKIQVEGGKPVEL